MFSSEEPNQYLSDPDVCLMLAFQKGDKGSFETLMKKYYARVQNFICRFVGNKNVAEDLTQEVFIRVYKKVSFYRPKGKFQTWLYEIAKNISLNELRKNKRVIISLDESIEGDDNEMKRQITDPNSSCPDKDILEKETQEVVKEAINALPPNQRMAVILRRYEDFSYGDIAKTMNCSPEAVKSLLSRARVTLKEKLHNYLKEL